MKCFTFTFFHRTRRRIHASCFHEMFHVYLPSESSFFLFSPSLLLLLPAALTLSHSVSIFLFQRNQWRPTKLSLTNTKLNICLTITNTQLHLLCQRNQWRRTSNMGLRQLRQILRRHRPLVAVSTPRRQSLRRRLAGPAIRSAVFRYRLSLVLVLAPVSVKSLRM